MTLKPCTTVSAREKEIWRYKKGERDDEGKLSFGEVIFILSYKYKRVLYLERYSK